MTERQLKLAITDDQWRLIDAILSDHVTWSQSERKVIAAREAIAAVHAIKVLVSTRHYHKD